jgi:hypothetical protein
MREQLKLGGAAAIGPTTRPGYGLPDFAQRDESTMSQRLSIFRTPGYPAAES